MVTIAAPSLVTVVPAVGSPLGADVTKPELVPNANAIFISNYPKQQKLRPF